MELLKMMNKYLINMNIATEEEINLVVSINGYSIDTFESILYAREGYRHFYQLMSWDGGEYE